MTIAVLRGSVRALAFGTILTPHCTQSGHSQEDQLGSSSVMEAGSGVKSHRDLVMRTYWIEHRCCVKVMLAECRTETAVALPTLGTQYGCYRQKKVRMIGIDPDRQIERWYMWLHGAICVRSTPSCHVV